MSKIPHDEAIVRLHGIFGSMLQRCNNTNNNQYADYGGRGIKVGADLSTWLGFKEYVLTLPGYDDSVLSLDRIDNDGGYVKGNLRFATKREQVLNRRTVVALPPNPEAVAKCKFSIIGKTVNTNNRPVFVCKCDTCTYTVTRRASHLQVGCQLKCPKCRTPEEAAAFKEMLNNLHTIDVGFESGSWVVIDKRPVPGTDGTSAVLCACRACGARTFQKRGKLLLQQPTHCASCYNNTQREHFKQVRLEREGFQKPGEVISTPATVSEVDPDAYSEDEDDTKFIH